MFRWHRSKEDKLSCLDDRGKVEREGLLHQLQLKAVSWAAPNGFSLESLLCLKKAGELIGKNWRCVWMCWVFIRNNEVFFLFPLFATKSETCKTCGFQRVKCAWLTDGFEHEMFWVLSNPTLEAERCRTTSTQIVLTTVKSWINWL